MDTYAVGARLRRARWGVWIGGFLLAVDGLIVPVWALWLGGWLGGGPGTVEVIGTVLPTWVCLLLGPLAILSVVAVVALVRAPRERGFRVASTVAIAWIALFGIAWVTGAMPVAAFLGRVAVLAFLVQGRTIRPATVGAV
jgi:hypothetical protein